MIRCQCKLVIDGQSQVRMPVIQREAHEELKELLHEHPHDLVCRTFSMVIGAADGWRGFSSRESMFASMHVMVGCLT